MSIDEKIESVFPYEDSIPEEFRLKNPVIQKEYLINGKLCIWNGEMQEVLSPVYLKTSSGFSQKLVGSYPLLTENESLEALDAATKAYNNGRGTWPTMPLYDRIQHIEGFINRMKASRKEMLHLLMWEIGKSNREAEEEFDRTIAAAKATDRNEAILREIVRERRSNFLSNDDIF